MLSALLFVMWYPLILRRSQNVYFAASGTHQNRYFGNWLLAVGILFGGSRSSSLRGWCAQRVARETTHPFREADARLP